MTRSGCPRVPASLRVSFLMKTLFVIAICWVWLALDSLWAGDDIAINGILARLIAVPAAELPDRAADMVKRCSPPCRVGVATNVVRAALMINPVAAPLVIAAVSREAPEVAAASANAATL